MATQLKKVVAPSGGDYTALESCMNANEQNLVTADKYFDVEISGTWSSKDTTNLTIHNYTTDATRYINIYTIGDAIHTGKPETGYVQSGTGYGSFSVGSQNVRITGVNIEGDSVIGVVFVSTGATALKAVNIIVKNGGFKLSGTNSNIFINCLSIDSPTVGFGDESGSSAIGWPYAKFYNCLSIRAGNRGFNSSSGTNGYFDCYNCAAFDSVTEDFRLSGGSLYRISGDYNASSDSSADGFTHDATGLDVDDEFIDSSDDDFRLLSDSSLIAAGNDYSGDHSISTDIVGVSRGATWDIGVFEYVSAGTTYKRRTLIGVGI